LPGASGIGSSANKAGRGEATQSEARRGQTRIGEARGKSYPNADDGLDLPRSSRSRVGIGVRVGVRVGVEVGVRVGIVVNHE
jgi:hypothetical protein